MKKTLVLFSLLIACVAMFAQSEPTFPYQAVVRNSQNQLIKDSTFAIDVEVYQATELKYSETQRVTTNANGQFTMNIGGGTAVSGSLTDVADWSVAKFKITCHLSGSDIVSENAVHPVPYTLQAANARERQVLSISNDTIYLTGGSYVKLPDYVLRTVMNNRIADTLNEYTLTSQICNVVNNCDFSTNAALLAVLDEMNHRLDSLNHLADSLSNLPHGGDTPAETTLTLTTDKSSATVKLCGADSVSVTYTATVENGSATEYTWSTSGGTPTASTTNTYTVNYATTGTYTVTCTAAGITATKSVEIASGGTAPALGLCEDCNAGSITVMTSTNVASIVWRNQANDSVSNSTTGLTQSATIPAGNYSATAASSDGCTVTRTATLCNATSHPCTVASFRSNERGTGTQLDSVEDHQHNWYRVVEINGQCWLAENMRCTTSPRQGTVNLQSGVTFGMDIDNPKYYDYNSTVSTSYPQVVTNSRSRGLLYNWVAAMDTMYTYPTRPYEVDFPNRRGICPEGWHLPTDDEWFRLEKNVLTNADWASVTSASGSDLGNRGTGAGKLTGRCVWSSSTIATAPGNYSYADRNNTGFSALPVGGYYYGSFNYSGSYACFWSATSGTSNGAWYRRFDYRGEGVFRDSDSKDYGFSVRCLRD